jgi:hypothetical protein
MTDVLKGKNALEQYTEERLAAAPVRQVISTAQPQSVSADEVMRLRDRLVGAAATAAGRQVENRQAIETAKGEAELMEVQERVDDARDQREERAEDRRRRSDERREDGQLSVIGLLREVISGGGPGAQELAAMRERLDDMTEKQRDVEVAGAIDELRAQHDELRAEIRTATAAGADRDSSPVDVVEEFERIARLQERARALFGDGVPAQTAMDLRVLEIKHRQSVQLMELEQRLQLDERRVRIEEEQVERDQVGRDARGGQIDSFLEILGPAVEKVLTEWHPGGGGANGATAAGQVLTAPAAAAAPGPSDVAPPAPPPDVAPPASPTPLRPSVAPLRCSNPACGEELLVYQGQNFVVCQSCGMVTMIPTASSQQQDAGAPEPEPEPSPAAAGPTLTPSA